MKSEKQRRKSRNDDFVFLSFSKDLEYILSKTHTLLDLGICQICLISRKRHKLTKMHIKEIASEIAVECLYRCKFLAVDSSV